jgi:hypothetical protein
MYLFVIWKFQWTYVINHTVNLYSLAKKEAAWLAKHGGKVIWFKEPQREWPRYREVKCKKHMAARRSHSGTGHLPRMVGKVDIQGIQSVFKLSSIFSREGEQKVAEYTVKTGPRPHPDQKKRCISNRPQI